MNEREAARFVQARRFERVSATLIASYRIAENVAAAFTQTYDLSAGGCGILTDVAIEEDQPITVTLELRGGDTPPLHLPGRVRWSRFDPLLDRYRTGIAFEDRLPDTEAILSRYVATLQRLRALGL